MQPILGWEINTIIIVVAVISGVYVSLGGQTAVIFTDFLQGVILLFAGLLIFGLGIAYIGGFDLFWDNLSTTNKLPFADFKIIMGLFVDGFMVFMILGSCWDDFGMILG